MAERRMFNKKITDSDAFIELSSSAQALYFHLNQGADDDGFNNQVQNAIFKSHSSTDDLKVLLTKKFLIQFENGVIVIKHWRMHNTLRKDRYTPTNYQKEFLSLGIKENGAYTTNIEDGCQTVAERLPNGCQMVALVKDRLVKDNKNNNNIYNKDKEKENVLKEKERESFTKNAENLQKKDIFELQFEEKELEYVDEKEMMFDKFWQKYPRKVNKKGAKTSFLRIKNLKKEFDVIMQKLDLFINSKQWKDNNGQFIPHPQTWINQERWKDETKEEKERNALEEWLNS